MINEIKNKLKIWIYKNKFLMATLAIITAVVFWGMSFVSMKTLINSGIPPYTMISLRYILVLVVLTLIVILSGSSNFKNMSFSDHKFFILSGMTGITTYFLFEAKGISLTTASNASLIIAMIPVFTLIADLIIFKKKFKMIQIFGIAFSVIGVFCIIYSSTKQEYLSGENRLLGNLLMLGACLSWVCYSIFSKRLNLKYSSFKVTVMQSIYGTIFLLPFTLLEKTKWVPITKIAWLNLLFLAVLCSIVSYYLYNLSIRILGITVISAYINLIPMVGFLGGVMILKESVNPLQLAGCLIIIVSLFLVNK